MSKRLKVGTHVADMIFRTRIVRVSLKEIVFRKFQDDSKEDHKLSYDLIEDFPVKVLNLIAERCD